MSFHRFRWSTSLLALFAVTSLGFIPSTHGATDFRRWDGSSSVRFDTVNGNWNNGNQPDSDDWVVFSVDFLNSGNQPNQWAADGQKVVGGLRFTGDETRNVFLDSLANSTSEGDITLDAITVGSENISINMASAVKNLTIAGTSDGPRQGIFKLRDFSHGGHNNHVWNITGGGDLTVQDSVDFHVQDNVNLTINAGPGRTVTIASSFSGNNTSATSSDLIKTGAGTLALTNGDNNFSGALTINDGLVTLGSTVGGNNTASGNVFINATVDGSAELRLLEAHEITDTKSVTLDNGGTFNMQAFSETIATLILKNGTVDGSGTLTTTNDFDVRAGTINAKLAGSVGLTKTTGGTVTLGGNNTYSGVTTIDGGTLQLATDNAISDSSNLIFNNGTTLKTGGFDDTYATLEINGTVIFDFESLGSSNLTFADSSGVVWGSVLNIINFIEGSDSIQFGNSSGGLSPTQLEDITINGLQADIDGGGYLIVAVPEPATISLVAFLGAALLGLGYYRKKRTS